MREANDRGYRCIVLGDCCASYFPEFHEMGLKMIKAQGGIFGWVSDSKKLLARSCRRIKGACAAERMKLQIQGESMAQATTFKPAMWTPGDWNAFFGFGTNILVNMLVLTGLLRFVLKMPDALVFGRILPAPRADDVPVHVLLRLARLSAGQENRPQRRLPRCLRASACRTCSSSPS